MIQYYPPGVQPPDVERKYYELLAKDSHMQDEHPSTVWVPQAGLSRVHIKEAYIFLDWRDSQVVKALRFFLEHAEGAFHHNDISCAKHSLFILDEIE